MSQFPIAPRTDDPILQKWYQDIRDWLKGSVKPADMSVNGQLLATGNTTVSATDITSGVLPHAQLPPLVSGDIPDNAADTSGNAATATHAATASHATLADTVTTVTETNFAFTDVTTANVDATKHGLFPRLPTPSGKFWRDDATWQTIPSVFTLPVYATNALALAGGLTAGHLYRLGADPDHVCVVH